MPYASSYRIPTPKAIPGGEAFYSQVNSWLIKWCYRALRRGQVTLDAQALEDYCWSRVNRYVVSTYDTFMGSGSSKAVGSRITDAQATRLIESVVSFVLSVYDPAEFSKIQAERARKRRRFTVAHLARYARLSIAATAQALGCSKSTVSRLRRQMKASAIGRLTLSLSQAVKKEGPDREGFYAPLGIFELAGIAPTPLFGFIDP